MCLGLFILGYNFLMPKPATSCHDVYVKDSSRAGKTPAARKYANHAKVESNREMWRKAATSTLRLRTEADSFGEHRATETTPGTRSRGSSVEAMTTKQSRSNYAARVQRPGALKHADSVKLDIMRQGVVTKSVSFEWDLQLKRCCEQATVAKTPGVLKQSNPAKAATTRQSAVAKSVSFEWDLHMKRCCEKATTAMTPCALIRSNTGKGDAVASKSVNSNWQSGVLKHPQDARVATAELQQKSEMNCQSGIRLIWELMRAMW